MGVTTSTARASVLQALSFGSVGAIYPFLALELKAAGIGGTVLFLALVSAPILRLLAGPAWGWLADRLGAVRGPLWAAAGLALAGVALILGVDGPLILAGTVLLAVGRAGATPLVEAAALDAVERDTGRYGGVRRWGSLGFMLAVILAGVGRDATGWSPLWIGLGCSGAFVAMTFTLPRVQAAPSPTGLGRDWWALVRDPGVLVVLAISALHFGGVVLYDAFFAVHLESLGLGTSWLGLTVGLGITTEIVVLSVGGWLLRRLGSHWLLVAAVAIHIPRWLLTALGTDVLTLVPIQAVHGFAFGGYWLASIALLTRRAPERLNGSVQGLLAASAGGIGALIGNGLGTVIVESAPTAMLFWTALGMSVIALVLAGGLAVVGGRGGEEG